MANVTLSGKTYQIRDLLKSKGGKYDPATKTWTISQEAYDRIASLDHGRHVCGVTVCKMSQKAYNDLYNEGGEGYNPYR